ncbi:MAG: Membrane-bound dehydrogenase domain protein, partial [Verrucomicrobiales bacterium]|nr:Membrane-bound dehydrogenase domain protein [Verrucomicrobiales bacterium]
MTRLIVIVAFCVMAVTAVAEQPMRVFIRAGEKTHGPGQHDAPQFLKDWKPLLESRGAKVDGALTFPTATQLNATDVLIIYCQNGGSIHGEDRANLEKFFSRGGGIVVLHDGVTSDDAQWFKTIVGGAWEYKRAKFFEGKISCYFQDHEHPILRGASNFDVDDEMYWDLHVMPDAHVLATTYVPEARNTIGGKQFPSIYDIAPQLWTYETNNHRAFVSLIGHNYKTFSLPQYRTLLLRAIAWAGKRDADSLVSKDELAALRYPEGGPTAPEKCAATFNLHPDFDINLVAAEPLIQKPISMDWDPQGRLWVAETPDYPANLDAR